MAGGIGGSSRDMIDLASGAGFDRFCRDRYASLVGLLGLYCGDRDLAEDLAQEALARLWRAWEHFETPADAQRWTNRVAFNLAKSSFRTRRTRSRILAGRGHLLEGDSPRGDDADAITVRTAVLALPARERRVILLRYFEDMTITEVADVLQCPEGTVKSLVRAAVHRLRKAGWEASDD